jgi:quinol-cytochrome oxidoreductase complex cytochrome b subunit
MLRWAIFAVGCLALVIAIAAALGGSGPGWIQLAVLGVVLVAAVLFERWRYSHPERRRPDANWQATGERFIDPESGKRMEVFFDPETGKRKYVEMSDRESP